MRRRRKSIDRALARMGSPEAIERSRAIVDLGYHPFDWRRARPAQRQMDQVFHRLTTLVRTDPSDDVRQGAAYALSSWHELRAAVVLLGVLTDATQAAAVRGQAAEGLGSLFQCLAPDRWRTPRAATIVALRAGLHDATADVRFWCLYALGVMNVREARADVEALVDDDAQCPAMWRVGDEARDVLVVFDGGDWPDRDCTAWGSERE